MARWNRFKNPGCIGRLAINWGAWNQQLQGSERTIEICNQFQRCASTTKCAACSRFQLHYLLKG